MVFRQLVPQVVVFKSFASDSTYEEPGAMSTTADRRGHGTRHRIGQVTMRVILREFWRFHELSFLLVLLVACNSKPTAHLEHRKDREDLRYAEVELGYGTDKCHLGMPISRLTGNWESGYELYPDAYKRGKKEKAEPLYNVEQGILVANLNGKVSSIHFMYYDKESAYDNFLGKTREGIGKRSTIRDVFKTYGDADSIMSVEGSDEESQRVSLIYGTLGAWFVFENDQLKHILIPHKQTHPAMEDVGDTSKLRKLAREVEDEE